MSTIILNIKKTIIVFVAGSLACNVSAQQRTGSREHSQQQQRLQREYRNEYKEEKKTRQKPLT